MRLIWIYLQYALLSEASDASFNAPFLEKCCGLNAPELMTCTLKASLDNERFLVRHQRVPGSTRDFKIGIVSFATSDIFDYAAYSFAVNEAFAENNHHIFKVANETAANYDPDSRWSKVMILSEALDVDSDWAKDLDYIMWVDADLVFVNMHFSLQEIVASVPNADIIASAEYVGSTTLINSGTVIVRRTDWARDFVRKWWTYNDRRLYSDQEQFDLLYKSLPIELAKNKIAVLPADVLNSDPPAMEKLKSHNSVVHLMGT